MECILVFNCEHRSSLHRTVMQPLHLVPLTTSSVTTSTRLKRGDGTLALDISSSRSSSSNVKDLIYNEHVFATSSFVVRNLTESRSVQSEVLYFSTQQNEEHIKTGVLNLNASLVNHVRELTSVVTHPQCRSPAAH